MIAYDVVVVGGGHGGAQAAAGLRHAGFAGTIAIVGDEPYPPYERPPLSKDYLSGERGFDRILIRPPSFWADKRIDLLLGRKVVQVEPQAHVVTTAAGEMLRYGALVWAAGGTPRNLACSGHDLVGVHTVRSRADVDRIKAELPLIDRVVVIGGGYVGLEAAAVLSKVGKRVTVVEALPRVLARVAGDALSRFYEAEHRAHGVDICLGATVACIEEADGRAIGVRLGGGELIAAPMVIVGIGIVPAVQPLLSAGAAGTDGVDVDDQCRTSLPDIYAIGDCAAHVNAFAGARVRLESVQNASDQAVVAARSIAGDPIAYGAVPWFWSNQFDLRLQTVGLSTGHDMAVPRGSFAARSFSIIYLRGGAVVALDCVNATRDYVGGRKLVEAGLVCDPARLADVSIPLKELAARDG